MVASSYDESLKRVLEYEGGYSNDAGDPGGPTRYGITIHDARAYWKPNATAADVRAMPLSVAKEIYRTKYWAKMDCDELPAGVDFAVFDFGVNSGISRSAKFLQRIVGTSVDGVIGAHTVLAAQAADPATVIARICDQRLSYLQALAWNWHRFGGGWRRRVHDVRAAALAMTAQAKK